MKVHEDEQLVWFLDTLLLYCSAYCRRVRGPIIIQLLNELCGHILLPVLSSSRIVQCRTAYRCHEAIALFRARQLLNVHEAGGLWRPATHVEGGTPRTSLLHLVLIAVYAATYAQRLEGVTDGDWAAQANILGKKIEGQTLMGRRALAFLLFCLGWMEIPGQICRLGEKSAREEQRPRQYNRKMRDRKPNGKEYKKSKDAKVAKQVLSGFWVGLFLLTASDEKG